MPTNGSLGSCPNCRTPLGEPDVLIRYDKRGNTALFAECPDCTDVVYLD